jgi:hypothetical protein
LQGFFTLVSILWYHFFYKWSRAFLPLAFLPLPGIKKAAPWGAAWVFVFKRISG